MTDNFDRVMELVRRLGDEKDDLRRELSTPEGQDRHLKGLVEPAEYEEVYKRLKEAEVYRQVHHLLGCCLRHRPDFADPHMALCVFKLAPPPPGP